MYQQKREWMAAFCSTAGHEAIMPLSDEQLQELFEEAGIPAKDVVRFLEDRADGISGLATA